MGLLVLVACSSPEAEEPGCPAAPSRVLSVSAEELDFGTVEAGASAERTLELRNDGSDALGVTGISLGEGRPDFAVAVGAVGCAREVEGIEAEDTGSPGFDTVGQGPVSVLLLEPDCVVPVTVTYTALTPGGAQDALLVQSNEAVQPAGEAYVTDVTARTVLVWLTSATDGEAPSESPTLVGRRMRVSATSVPELEPVALEARARGADVTWQWSAEEGTFDDPYAPAPTWRAPRVDSSRTVTLYVVSYDTFGGQDWTFERVTVTDVCETP